MSKISSKTESLEYLRTAMEDATLDFRDGQWEAIDHIVNQRGKALCVQRTGWGKSMVYFLSAKLMRAQGAGVTLIISPLLALMRNQIEAANRLGLRALTVNSTNIQNWNFVRDELLADRVDLLLISPERLAVLLHGNAVHKWLSRVEIRAIFRALSVNFR